MRLFETVRKFFETDSVELPDNDPVGPVLSQMYGDILDHRELLSQPDRDDYRAYTETALRTLHEVAPDEVSKRALLVLVAEELRR